MTFETFLDGLNKGGFAFLGMVLIAAILAGGIKFTGWLFKEGWPNLMAALGKSGEDYKASVETQASLVRESMAQTQQIIDRQSQMVDTVMDGHKTIITKMDTVIARIDGIADKVGK